MNFTSLLETVVCIILHATAGWVPFRPASDLALPELQAGTVAALYRHYDLRVRTPVRPAPSMNLLCCHEWPLKAAECRQDTLQNAICWPGTELGRRGGGQQSGWNLAVRFRGFPRFPGLRF